MDLSVDPAFEVELQWMKDLMKDEVLPLEVLEADPGVFRVIIRELQEEVKERGLALRSRIVLCCGDGLVQQGDRRPGGVCGSDGREVAF